MKVKQGIETPKEILLDRVEMALLLMAFAERSPADALALVDDLIRAAEKN